MLRTKNFHGWYSQSALLRRIFSILCILLSIVTLNGEVNLPGIDVLSSGFDSASWTSKSRIFDLDEDGKKVYLRSIDKTFISPAYVSVVSHGRNSKRVEESCVGVYSKFSDYLHTYQSSVSIAAGIKFGNFGLGISAHHDVKEVYEAITRNGEAIGISESWWGIYEATLPPPFLMTSKFSSLFKQSVAYLKKIGIPKTEEQQRIYNQVCCGAGGFGTHYVGSIIVGGRAKVTSFVGSNYHKQYSEKTVSNQVSIGFEYLKFNLSLSSQSKDFEKRLMESFKNDSNHVISYQPDMKEIHSAKAPWLAWEKAVTQNPTVVNTSVSSMANLIFDNPEVQAHMQKTIDFYIKWDKQPRLSDVRTSLDNLLFSYAKQSNNLVPGLKIVGCGFDVTTLSSKKCLFQQASSGLPHSNWSNPYYPDIAYRVPYGFFATNTPESLILNSTVIMNTIDDYIHKSVYYEHHHDSGFLGFGSKDETITTRKYYRMFYAHNYKLALSMRQIAWYTLRLLQFPLPLYNKEFKLALDYLPPVYDPSNATIVSIYKMFFDSFGTDVVTAADMGGMVWAEDWFESCLSKIYSDTCITDEVSRGWWFVHNHHDTRSCDKRIVDDFKKYSEHHFEMLGGTSGQIKQKDWNKWVRSVKYDPRPVKYTLAPIHYLLYDSHAKKKALRVATDAYLRRSQDGRSKIIESLESIRPPPASICKRIKKQEMLANKFVNVFASMLSLPLENNKGMSALDGPTSSPGDILCPFVGYHGNFCPVKYQRILRSMYIGANAGQELQPLPRGVGLTIDVTTGELRLPALTYVDSNETWTDPLSAQVYRVPYGVSLSTKGVTAENTPITRVFKNEEQLAAVWEAGYKNGNWLGGEFGRSKSILELFEKFFSKQQATSINQRPHGLYKLSLTGQWEKKLNEFALKSLRALPAKYNSNAYNRFIDTWGTHIAKDTLVGGMIEQQVIMKECIWKSPYLSGGVSDDDLQKYLKMELTKVAPKNSFYRSRRKMHIDHRIGGNPDLSDDKEWARTLSRNPVLIKIYSQVEWATVAKRARVVSKAVVENLRRSLRERIKTRENERRRESDEAKKRRLVYLQAQRSAASVAARGARGSTRPTMQTKDLTMRGFSECHEGISLKESGTRCNTGVVINSWVSMGKRFRLGSWWFPFRRRTTSRTRTIRAPLRYERNAQGDMRSVRCFLPGHMSCVNHRGPWIKNGCSVLPYENGRERPFHSSVPANAEVGMVCAGCQLITSEYLRSSKLECVCPGY